MKPVALLLPLLLLAGESGLTLKPGYKETASIASKHATQAAAADDKYAYAVSNTTVEQFDRSTGERVRSGTAPDAKHLNSAYILDGKVYCAHSNYPKLPEESDIRVYDPETGRLELFHRFDEPPGSLVWCLKRDGNWWCCFAHYKADNAKTILVEYEGEFEKELRRFTFPDKVVNDWDKMSASGGIWDNDTLLTTHHHFKVLYRLKLPEEGSVLEFVEALDCPFPGQGVAVDPKTGGLVGIDRPGRKIVFAEKE